MKPRQINRNDGELPPPRQSRLLRGMAVLYSVLWRLVVIVTIGIGGLGLGMTIGVIDRFSRDIPDVETILAHKPSLITNCYDRSGQVFAQFYLEKREIVSIKEINPLLQQASIAVEDLRFYQHHGIDITGITRAMWTNVLAGRIVQGGSTITQQLARTLFLTREKKYSRKVKEALLSLNFERTLTKSQILELYFNEIYFGHGCYGIQAASKTFFGKDNREMTLAECALLAGLPKAPNSFSPYDYPEASFRRRDVVLMRMHEAQFISQAEMSEASQTPLNLLPLQKRRGKAPYVEEYVRQIIEPRFGTAAVHRGGLHVRTSIDLSLQKASEEALRWGLHAYERRRPYRGPLTDEEVMPELEGYPKPGMYGLGIVTAVSPTSISFQAGDFSGEIPWKTPHWTRIDKPDKRFKAGDRIVVQIREDGYDAVKQKCRADLEQNPHVEGAVIALDPHNGEILALVGGYHFDRSKFNRAVQAVRQPGSSFKPIVYSTALDNGYTASSIIYDSPIVEMISRGGATGDDSTSESEPETWKPSNYDETFLGPTTLRNALEKSRNLVTIRLLQNIGIRLVSRYAKSYGLSTPVEENLSMALGASGVIPLELTSAYAVFANQGVRTVPRCVLEVSDPAGKKLWESGVTAFRVLDERIAFLTATIMQGVVEYGTGQAARSLGRPLAGKTGTTNEFKDAWFIGFSPDIVLCVWVGFDRFTSLGPRESGALTALPIWIKIMQKALPSYPYATFTVPDGIEFTYVDKNTGLLANEKSKNVIREAFLAGLAPASFSREGATAGSSSSDLSTDLMMIEQLVYDENSNDTDEARPFADYPGFD